VNVFSGAIICNTDNHQEVITIIGPPTITILPTTIEQCGPGIIDLSSVATYNPNGDPITDYLWTINPLLPVGTPPTITPLPSDPNPIITLYGDVTQAYSLTVAATNTCGTTTSSVLTINETQSLSNNTIIPPATSSLCSGTPISNIIGDLPTPSGGNGTYTYQWWIQEGIGVWNLISGQTGNNLNYTLPLTVDPTKFKRVVTSGSCILESNIVEFSVINGIQGNTISSPQSICSGNAPLPLSGSTTTGGNNVYSYKWQQSTNAPIFNIWVDAPSFPNSNDNISYIPEALTQTTRYKRIVYSGICELPSNEIEITVYPVPVINTAAAVTICSDVDLNYAISSTVPGTAYSWVVTDFSGGDITGWNNYPGWASTTIVDHLINSSSIPKTIKYTISPKGPLPTNCPGNDFILIVTVRPKLNSTYSNQSINIGTSTTLTGVISGGTTPPGYSYSWIPVNMLALGQSTLPNPQTVVLNSPQTYTLTVTDRAGCQLSQTVTVSTSGIPMSVNLTSSDLDLTVCEGNTITLTAIALGGGGGGIPGNYTYSWVGLPGTVTYIQPWIVQFVPVIIGSNNYSVNVGDGFTTTSAGISITMNKIPSVTSALLRLICSGEDVNYTPLADVPGTTFNWTRGVNSCISSVPFNNTGNNNINNVLTNSCITEETINYSITPTGPAPTFCVGASVPLVVKVKPVASITNIINTQTVVSGYLSAAVTFNSDVLSAGIHWKYLSDNCGGFVTYSYLQGYTATIPAQIISLSTGSPATCTLRYKVRPYVLITIGDTCWGNPFIYNFVINSEPLKYDMICPMPICAGQTATISLGSSEVGINYVLYQGANPILPLKPGTGVQLDWSGIGIGGAYTIIATNPINGQSATMNGRCQLVVNPLPVSNYLIGSTGPCPGAIITLNESELGVNYELNLAGSPVEVLPGTGDILNFTYNTLAGLYTIRATSSAGCSILIDGSVFINENPEEFLFTPAGIQCVGDVLSLDGSQIGITYELWCNPLVGPGPVFIPPTFPGTDLPIPFGPQNIAGTYFIRAINLATTCFVYFPVQKVVRPNPVKFNITPPPSAIPNCGATTTGLSNSEFGFQYFLHKIDPITGLPSYPAVQGPVTGTGSAITFPIPVSAEGEYVVIAWELGNICDSRMNGSVIIEAVPTQYSINPPDGPFCIDQGVGKEITLDHSDIGVEYTLNPIGIVRPGLGGTGPLSFGFITQPGIYTITAKNLLTTCEAPMLGSVELLLNPTHYAMYPISDFCPGDFEIRITGSEANVMYTLHTPIPSRPLIPIAGGAGAINWGTFYYPGTYYITAQYIVGNPCTIQLGTVNIYPSQEFI
jgi:hypothetical protein